MIKSIICFRFGGKVDSTAKLNVVNAKRGKHCGDVPILGDWRPSCVIGWSSGGLRVFCASFIGKKGEKISSLKMLLLSRPWMQTLPSSQGRPMSPQLITVLRRDRAFLSKYKEFLDNRISVWGGISEWKYSDNSIAEIGFALFKNRVFFCVVN